MCYNEFNGLRGEKCRVTIRSCGNGWKDEVTTVGEMFRTAETLHLNYSLDGDQCRLTVKDGVVIQERKGLQNLRLSFCENNKTTCIIGGGNDGLSGSFEIITRSLKFVMGKGGFKLMLEYNSGTDGEEVSLSLTAAKI